MKPFVLIATAALLLSGCQSKKEICARWSAVNNDNWTDESVKAKNDRKADRKLGLEGPPSNLAIYSFCEFYKG